jgi:hypothetical protein
MLTTHGRRPKIRSGERKAALTGCRCRRRRRSSRSSCTRTAAAGSWTKKGVSSKSSTNGSPHRMQGGGKRLTIPLQLTHLRLGGSLRSPRTTRSFRSSSFLDPAAIALAEPKRRTGLVGGRRRSLDPPCLSAESSAISTRAEQTPESRWWRCACL